MTINQYSTIKALPVTGRCNEQKGKEKCSVDITMLFKPFMLSSLLGLTLTTAAFRIILSTVNVVHKH